MTRDGGAASGAAKPAADDRQRPADARSADERASGGQGRSRPSGPADAIQPPVAQPQAAQPQPIQAQPAQARPAQAQPAQPAQRPAPGFTHAPGAAGAPAAPAAPHGQVSVDVLRQAWPSVVEAIKAKGRVAALVIGNASVASFDEGVLTLRFPRQGDVKGFQGGKYEDLLKQAIASMFGINVVVRAVTGGGDAPSAGRLPSPPPGPPAPNGQPSQGHPSQGQPSQGPPPAASASDYASPGAAGAAGAEATSSARPSGWSSGAGPGAAGPLRGAAGNGAVEGTRSFGGPGTAGGDLPPLPPPPSPDDDDFDPDDEDMSDLAVNELSAMDLIKRELGAQVIAEYDD